MTFKKPKESALDRESIAFLNIFLSLTAGEIFAKNARNSNLVMHIQGYSAIGKGVPPDFFTPGDAYQLGLHRKLQLGNTNWGIKGQKLKKPPNFRMFSTSSSAVIDFV